VAIGTRLLVLAGLVAPFVFIGVDLLTGSSWRGYDFAWRSISELSAVGSPVRRSAAPLFALVNVLTIAFGAGVWRSAGGVATRVVAAVIVANGVLALAAAFFPNQVGVPPRFLTPGVLLAAASVLCVVIAMALAVFAFGGWLRVYSISALVAYLVLTIIGYASQMQPRVGLQERLVAYTWMAWLGLLAATVLAGRLERGF